MQCGNHTPVLEDMLSCLKLWSCKFYPLWSPIFPFPPPSISSKALDSHVQDMAQPFQKFLLDVAKYWNKYIWTKKTHFRNDENWTGCFFSFWRRHYLSLSDSLRGTNCVALTDNSCSMNLQIGKYLVQIWSYILKGQKNKANIKISCYSWLKLYLLNIDNQAFL